MSYDPKTIEHYLGRVEAIDSRPERPELFPEPTHAIWFLLGKGLSPQEIYEVLSAWWWEGYHFGARSGPSVKGPVCGVLPGTQLGE